MSESDGVEWRHEDPTDPLACTHRALVTRGLVTVGILVVVVMLAIWICARASP